VSLAHNLIHLFFIVARRIGPVHVPRILKLALCSLIAEIITSTVVVVAASVSASRDGFTSCIL
jgi:hypothetical protein